MHPVRLVFDVPGGTLAQLFIKTLVDSESRAYSRVDPTPR
jgi:hypothetical protein